MLEKNHISLRLQEYRMYHYWRVWQIEASGNILPLELWWQWSYLYPERLWS